MLMNDIWSMQSSGALGIRLRLLPKETAILLLLLPHCIMAASPHVASTGSHDLHLLLPIIGLNYRSPIISTGDNTRPPAIWLALLALPPIRMFLLESP